MVVVVAVVVVVVVAVVVDVVDVVRAANNKTNTHFCTFLRHKKRTRTISCAISSTVKVNEVR